MADPPRLGDVVAALDGIYDPRWAESWDAVGLVCGDPEMPVRRVLLAVDPVAAVADEARTWSADLLVTHHPLFLRGVHSVAATTPKGRLVSGLIAAGIALHVVHTNADSADPGVSDALAAALGLVEQRPLEPATPGTPEERDKLVTFVPHGDTGRLLDALAAAGAGHLGDYSRCAFTVAGVGTFRPEPGAHSTIGTVGAVAEVPETRVEMVLPRESRAEVVRALRAVHPYEEPELDLFELADLPASRGLGRVGRLPRPEPLRDVAVRVAAAVPATPIGVRVAGDLDRVVGTVAVCGGAGDGLLPAVRGAGAEVFVTADLRHHPASEAVADGRLALVDAGHWATEWLWLTEAARRLEAALAERGTTVSTRVSRIVTDPWTLHLPSPRSTH